MYFTYKVRYTNSSTEIPEFPIAPEIALELLMAANFTCSKLRAKQNDSFFTFLCKKFFFFDIYFLLLRIST
jgi:hypothetical protein